MSFTFIDLFAGIGGFRSGFEQAGGKCLLASEIDKHARKVYADNYDTSDEIMLGDITKIPADTVPAHDVLLAGFPCQPFSIAGERKGFEDTRGTLFFDVARILDKKQTPGFALENVKGLISHDEGNTYRVICKTLRDLGYGLSIRVLNAGNWLPQNRNRIFIVGHRNNPRFEIDFMNVPNDKSCLGDILEDDPDPKTTLTDGTWRFLQKHKEKHMKLGNSFGARIANINKKSNTITARYWKDGREVLIAQKGKNPRMLTVKECIRLMGFPESFEMNIPKREAYRCLGNAIAPPVSRAIAEHLFQ